MPSRFNIKALETVKNKELAILVLPKETYNEDMLRVVKNLAKRCDLLCYVSLNKPYTSLVKAFKEHKIDTNKFLFIDDAPNYTDKNEGNCIHLSSSSDLTGLSIILTKAMERANFKCLIFDSLSSLLIYNNSSTVIKFAHDLIGKLRSNECTSFFVYLSNDMNDPVLKDLYMFVDTSIGLATKVPA